MTYSIWTPNELYHHGIDGQKWGIKHGPPYPLGFGRSDNKKKKVKKNVETKKQKQIRKNTSTNKELSTHYLTRHRLKNMTNAEIDAKIKRLQKEKELVTLSKEIEQSGEGFIRKAMKNVGQKTLETAAKGAALYVFNAIGDNKFEYKALMKAMATGKVNNDKKKEDKDKDKD